MSDHYGVYNLKPYGEPQTIGLRIYDAGYGYSSDEPVLHRQGYDRLYINKDTLRIESNHRLILGDTYETHNP